MLHSNDTLSSSCDEPVVLLVAAPAAVQQPVVVPVLVVAALTVLSSCQPTTSWGSEQGVGSSHTKKVSKAKNFLVRFMGDPSNWRIAQCVCF